MSGGNSDVDRTYQRTTDIEELRDNDGVVYATRNYASIPRYKLAPLDKSSFVSHLSHLISFSFISHTSAFTSHSPNLLPLPHSDTTERTASLRPTQTSGLSVRCR